MAMTGGVTKGAVGGGGLEFYICRRNRRSRGEESFLAVSRCEPRLTSFVLSKRRLTGAASTEPQQAIGRAQNRPENGPGYGMRCYIGRGDSVCSGQFRCLHAPQDITRSGFSRPSARCSRRTDSALSAVLGRQTQTQKKRPSRPLTRCAKSE